MVSVRGKWFLVTAGHALKEVAGALAAGRIRIVRSFLAAYFGNRATLRRLIPFHYDVTAHKFEEDSKLGLDYGFIPLSELFRAGLEANGIEPLSAVHWKQLEAVRFSAYALLGFPEDLAKDYDKESKTDDPLDGSIGTVVISAERVDDKSLIPDAEDEWLKLAPWFTGRITAETNQSIKGMSGGPIFGLCKMPDGTLGYTVVAIQSRWLPKNRFIFECPISLFGELVERFAAGIPDQGASL